MEETPDSPKQSRERRLSLRRRDQGLEGGGGERRLGPLGLSRDTWSHFASLKASVMSTASAPCHYLSLHALISSPTAPWDTYNEGNTEQGWCRWNKPPGQQGR